MGTTDWKPGNEQLQRISGVDRNRCINVGRTDVVDFLVEEVVKFRSTYVGVCRETAIAVSALNADVPLSPQNVLHAANTVMSGNKH